jgi:hypothetical protein
LLDAMAEVKSAKLVPQSIEELKQELGISGQKEQES